jgi:hypothetical protein
MTTSVLIRHAGGQRVKVQVGDYTPTYLNTDEEVMVGIHGDTAVSVVECAEEVPASQLEKDVPGESLEGIPDPDDSVEGT